MIKIDEKTDKYGLTPACWVSGADRSIPKIHEFLFNNYQGYKFLIPFDCMGDEYEEPEKEVPVYFMDEIAEEVLEYIGVQQVEKWLKSKKEAVQGVIQ